MLNTPSVPHGEMADHPLVLPWVPGDQRLLLTNQIFMRKSAVRTDCYEVECEFAQLDETGQRFGSILQAWAPLEHLSVLRAGSIFEGKTLVGQRSDLHMKQATNFRPRYLTELKEIYPGRYQTSGERREDEPVSSMILLATSACVGDHDNRRIHIPSSEILRFYFGPISWLADSFMSAVYGAPGDGLFDPEETRFIEPGVFQIAPAAGLADRASALHLALLLNSPDLLQLWREASDASLGSERREGGVFRSTLMLPEGKHSLALLGRNSSVARFMLVAQERAFVASAIISDYRPAPFSKLVVKLPYGMNESDTDNIDDASYNPRTRFNTVVAFDAKLEARRRPGIQAARLSPHHESLRRTFPGLSRVTVQYDVASLARNQPREVERRIRMVETLSALSPRSDPKVGGVLFRPSKAYFPPAQLERPSRSLFEAISTEAGRFESFAVTELNYPLSIFVKAMNRLSNGVQNWL